MESSKPKQITCIIVDDEAMAREVLVSHLSKIDNISIVGSCTNAMEAFNIISSNPVDLVFLDINMPKISGIAFAKSINSNIKIIFTTAYRDYAVEGFELKAVDYLLKPISLERLEKAVNNYFDIYVKPQIAAPEASKDFDFIFIRSDRKMIKLEFDKIRYIESFGDYLKIHTNKKTIVTRETISSIEAKLPRSNFLRIHRSYIISLESIESYTNEYVTLDQKALPIGRSYKKQVLEFLKIL